MTVQDPPEAAMYDRDAAVHGPGNYSGRDLLRILDDALASVSAVEANLPREARVDGIIELGRADEAIRSTRRRIDALMERDA